MSLLGISIARLRRGAGAQILYDLAINQVADGNVAAARATLEKLKSVAKTPADQWLVFEAEIWCLLCDGKVTQARDVAARVTTSSPLLLAVLGVVAGTSEGAIDTLADALRQTPSADLVTHALVSCGAAAQFAALLEHPGVSTRISDYRLQSASALVFHAGAYDACERICVAAFRAYGSPVHLFNAACCASRRGEVEAGIAHLQGAVRAGWTDRALLASDPDLANLRVDPRFAEFR